MDALTYLLIFSVVVFISVSLFIFFKRFKEHKVTLNKISSENAIELKNSFEEEVKRKREEEFKKLQKGDKNAITEVLERIFKSSKLAGWIKSNTFNIHNSKSISIIINISGKEELVNTQKEIVLKTGEVYTQNKHYLAVKKEYSEKVFICANKVLEEVFGNIPTIYKIYLSEYINDEEKDNPVCVLTLEANKDQFIAMNQSNISNGVSKIDFFNARYNYDSKNYDFNEVEPVKTPSGETSLEKTMSAKANSNTVLYGSTVIDSDGSFVNLKNELHNSPPGNQISSKTKISDLNGSSFMLDKTFIVNELDKMTDTEPVSEVNNQFSFEEMISSYIKTSGFKVISENKDDNNFIKIFAINPSLRKNIILHIFLNNETVKEEYIYELKEKMSELNIEDGIFIAKEAFSLDAVSFAIKNHITLIDKEKLSKVIL